MALPTLAQLNDPEWQRRFIKDCQKPLPLIFTEILKGVEMSAVAERLANLKANLASEPDKNGIYAQDLKASIKSCEQAIENEGKSIPVIRSR